MQGLFLFILIYFLSYTKLVVTWSKIKNIKREANPEISKFPVQPVKLTELKYHVFLMIKDNVGDTKYKAFCSGTIIGKDKILTSSHCIYTNKKNLYRRLDLIRVVAALLHTTASENENDKQQWRTIEKVTSQSHLRHPAYCLCVMTISPDWAFNENVGDIPLATKNDPYDGVCHAPLLKILGARSKNKQLFVKDLKVLTKDTCESISLANTWHYYCTEFDIDLDYHIKEVEGGGLVCHDTGDPAEKDIKVGVLVAMTVKIFYKLPAIHSRIAPFHNWIIDRATSVSSSFILVCLSTVFYLTKNFQYNYYL